MSSDSKATPLDHSQESNLSSTGTVTGVGGGVAEYVPYPKIDPEDAIPVPNTWRSEKSPSDVDITSRSSPTHPYGGSTDPKPTEPNPYVFATSEPKNNVEKFKDALGSWGKKASEATKKAEDLAGNMWQHLKTGPSIGEAAVGRIAQTTKVLSEGGYEKVFRHTFETDPEEKLLKSYDCYLSTSAGPIVGIIYLSSAKVAFCSDNPLSYKVAEETCLSYYKVIIPLHQLKAVNPSTSKSNTAEKYIQIISVDNNEFWFMGFLNYDSAVKNLKGALKSHHL